MSDKLEGGNVDGRVRSATSRPNAPKPAPAKPKRKAETPTITDDLTGKFLRVGNKLYRTSDNKKPIVRIEPDRLVTSNLDALPDIVRIAKANGWTSIKLTGGDKFKKAAFLAAAAQGMEVENYRPSKIVQAEADRFRARLAEREMRREGKKTGPVKPQAKEELSKLKALSQRFLNQPTPKTRVTLNYAGRRIWWPRPSRSPAPNIPMIPSRHQKRLRPDAKRLRSALQRVTGSPSSRCGTSKPSALVRSHRNTCCSAMGDPVNLIG